jgi:fucose permease
MTAIFGLGSAIAPPIAGLIADATGSFAVANHLAALALVAGAACAWAAKGRG